MSDNGRTLVVTGFINEAKKNLESAILILNGEEFK